MIQRLSSLFGWLVVARRSPNPRVRAAWWVTAFACGCLGWILPATGTWVQILWITANSLYVLIAVGWCLIHPRSILGGREISLRWSVLSTLFASVILFSQLYTLIEQIRQTTEGANNTPAVVAVITAALCPLVFCLILGLGIAGAMVGSFAMRRGSHARAVTQSAVGFWFCCFVVLGLWSSVFQHHSDARTMYGFSIPLLTVAYCHLANGPASPIRRAVQTSVLWIERNMIVRRNHGRWRRLDLRGAALGLLAAAIMLVAPTVLIAPLKTLALVTLVKIRTATVQHIQIGGERPFAQLQHNDDLVILNLDPETRHRILTGSSEAAIQTEIIRRLTVWGARQIVLPTPLVHPRQYEAATGQPAPDDAAVRRCRHDLSALARAPGNILITLPPLHGHLEWHGSDYSAPNDPDLAPLFKKAPGTGAPHIARADLPISNAVHLPIIPEHVKALDLISVPVALSMTLRNVSVPLKNNNQDTDLSDFVGSQLPQITPEGVLVNFLGQGPRYDFFHIDYSTLLRGEMIHATRPNVDEALGTGNWQKPAQFFHRGQVVLLDSVLHPLVTTPLGVMSQPEVFAYATATLLSGASIQPVTALNLVLVTLLTGLCIGATCFRRDPLDAIWRATIPMFLIVMISLGLFIVGGIWLDPVLPLGTALITLPVVTQLSFAQERNERRRTRALFQRFVASDQLDNWLAMPEDALALGGKRQTVCVVFADARNFTHFAELNEADKVIEVINAYMSGLTEALHRHGGVLDKYTGDGLMAWFPVKESPFDDLKNAVEAALAMRDAAIEIARELPLAEQLEIGFGLHYGDAVVGLVGSEKLQINWTAMGRTVVVSARLQTIAGGGEVVISERLYEATAGAFAVVEGEPVMVKGLSAPVRPFRVLGATPAGNPALVPATPSARSLPSPPSA